MPRTLPFALAAALLALAACTEPADGGGGGGPPGGGGPGDGGGGDGGGGEGGGTGGDGGAGGDGGSGGSACVPDCTGRTCGPDPRCGESCGTCGDGTACSDEGACEAVPACADATAVCGSFGCVVDATPRLVQLSGSIAWNGTALRDPSGRGEPDWYLAFVDQATGLRYVAQFDAAASYRARIYPGTFDLYLGFRYDGVVADQQDGEVRVADDLRLVSDGTLDIDPRLVTIQGDVAWGGQALRDPSGRGEPDWYLAFVEHETGLRRVAYFDAGARYTTKVVPGVYDVYMGFRYDGVVSGQLDGEVRIANDLRVVSDGTLDVDPRTVTLSGSVSWDGEALTDPSGRGEPDWYLAFVNRDTGIRYTASFDAGPTWSTRIYPGTYDVFMGFRYDGVAPRQLEGEVRISEALRVVSDGTLDVAPVLVDVQGVVSWDGQRLGDPSGRGETDWYLAFVEHGTGIRRTVRFEGNVDRYATKMVAGTYDVFFGFRYDGVVQGQLEGEHRVAEGFRLTLPARLDVEPTLVDVSGRISWDGQTLRDPSGRGETDWYLAFVEQGTGIRYVSRFEGGIARYATRIYPGTYDVFLGFRYDGVVTGQLDGEVRVADGLRLNTAAILHVEPTLVGVTGDVAWGGETPRDPSGRGETDWYLAWVEAGSGLRFVSRFEGNVSSYQTRMYPGVYDVYLGFRYDDVVPYQLDGEVRVARCVELAP